MNAGRKEISDPQVMSSRFQQKEARTKAASKHTKDEQKKEEAAMQQKKIDLQEVMKNSRLYFT